MAQRHGNREDGGDSGLGGSGGNRNSSDGNNSSKALAGQIIKYVTLEIIKILKSGKNSKYVILRIYFSRKNGVISMT